MYKVEMENGRRTDSIQTEKAEKSQHIKRNLIERSVDTG